MLQGPGDGRYQIKYWQHLTLMKEWREKNTQILVKLAIFIEKGKIKKIKLTIYINLLREE